MACVKFLRTVCPRVLLANRWTSLTMPAVSLHNQTDKSHRKMFCTSTPRLKKETISLVFVMPDGEKVKTKATVGDNLLDTIIDNDVDIDGFGACEGTLACSTCHLIFTPQNFSQLPEPPTDEEMDMLDLAFDLQDSSRLGCQVIVTKNMDGWEIKVPTAVSDAREPS